MLAVEKKKKYTIEDYNLLEEGAPFQLINNDLIMSPSPLPIHQVISIRLGQIILNFLDSINDDGVLMGAPMDVKLDDGNVFQPDMLYIANDRKDLIKNIVEGAPDLIIEILPPSNAYYDLRLKKDTYERYGVKEYIIIDPVQENADLYILKDGIYVLHQRAQKTESLKSVVIYGLIIEIAKLFK